MNVKTGQSITVLFPTQNPATGAATDATAPPTGTLYVNGTADGATVTVTNITTGLYKAALTLPTLSAGDVVSLRISATVSAIAGTAVVWQAVGDTVRSSDLATPTNITAGTITTVTNLTNLPAITAGWLTAAGIAADAITDAKVASDVTIASVTGSVGSVVGNVGGNVTGSVGSIATAGITSASFDAGAINAAAIAVDAIGSDEIAASAVTKIQAGLATSANVTAVETDTQDIQSRLPSALMNGNMSSYVAAMGNNTLTALALATDAVTEIQAGLATQGNITALNNISTAQVKTQVDNALVDIHLDHLLAVDYDPTSKPGNAAALLNELVQGNGTGVSQFAAITLELAPTGGSAPSAATIAAAVWLEQVGNHSGTAGSTAEALTNASSAGDPWSASLPGIYGNGTAGSIVGNRLDVVLSTRASQTSVDDVPTNSEFNARTLPTADYGNQTNQATIIAKIDTVDGIVDSIVADTNELQLDLANGGRVDLLIDEINAKTTNLPSDPADASVVAGLIAAVETKVDTIDTVVDTILVDTAELQADWTNGGRLDNILDARASQTSVDDLPTNAELATSQAAADDATLAAIAALNNISAAQVNAEVDTALADAGVTTTRTAYLNNLNVGGLVASSAEVTSIQNNTRVVRVVPTLIERPDSGTTTYRIELMVYDEVGNMEALVSAPTVALVNQAGTDLSDRLGAATEVSDGHYRWLYTANVAHTLEQLIWTFSVTEGAVTRVYGNTSVIVDTTAVDFTASDRADLQAILADTADMQPKLGAPAGVSISADIVAIKAQTQAIEADTQDLQTQVGTDGAGLTNLPWNAAWDAQVESEVTGALNAYDPPTNAEMVARTLAAASYATASGVSAVETDTQDIQSRLPAALVSGNMSSHVVVMANNTLTAAALATDAVNEIQAGLATPTNITAGNITTVGTTTNLTNLPTMPTDWLSANGTSAAAVTKIQNSLATTANITALNNISTAQVKTQVDNALVDIHLDHLLAADYNPDAKPGNATALFNELVQGNGTGVSQFAAITLELAPTGGGGGDATEANQLTILTFLDANIGVGGANLTATGFAMAADLATVSDNLDSANTTIHIAIDGLAAAGDPWSTDLPGDYSGTQAGKILSDILADTADMQPKIGTPETSVSADIAGVVKNTNLTRIRRR